MSCQQRKQYDWDCRLCCEAPAFMPWIQQSSIILVCFFTGGLMDAAFALNSFKRRCVSVISSCWHLLSTLHHPLLAKNAARDLIAPLAHGANLERLRTKHLAHSSSGHTKS